MTKKNRIKTVRTARQWHRKPGKRFCKLQLELKNRRQREGGEGKTKTNFTFSRVKERRLFLFLGILCLFLPGEGRDESEMGDFSNAF